MANIQGPRDHSSGSLNISFHIEGICLMFPLFCSKPKGRDNQDRERVEESQGRLYRPPHRQSGQLCKNSLETPILD